MSLQEEMHTLVEGIISARETRADGSMLLQQQVAGQREEARDHIQRLHLGRQETSRQERKRLFRAEGERITQVRAWLGDVAGARQGLTRQQRTALTQDERERITQVRAWLGDVAGARQGMARQMYAALNREHVGLARAEAERGSRFQRWLGELASDRSAAGIEWRRLAALHGERAGISKASAGADEFSRARDRVFQHLASHPDGLRLTEIEREFGMSRFESAKAMKELVKSGKAEKRDLLYFAM